jgi:hypothetical protein
MYPGLSAYYQSGKKMLKKNYAVRYVGQRLHRCPTIMLIAGAWESEIPKEYPTKSGRAKTITVV